MVSLFSLGKTKIANMGIYNKSGHLKLIAFCGLIMFLHLGIVTILENMTVGLLSKTPSNDLEIMNQLAMKFIPPFLLYSGAFIILISTFWISVRVQVQRDILKTSMRQNMNQFSDSKTSALKTIVLVTAVYRLCHHFNYIYFPEGKLLSSCTEDEINEYKKQRLNFFEKINNHAQLADKPLIDFLNLNLTNEQIEYLKKY